MSKNILPQQKTPKLIVVVAFDRDEDGELQPVFGPAEQQRSEPGNRRVWRADGTVSGRRRARHGVSICPD